MVDTNIRLTAKIAARRAMLPLGETDKARHVFGMLAKVTVPRRVLSRYTRQSGGRNTAWEVVRPGAPFVAGDYKALLLSQNRPSAAIASNVPKSRVRGSRVDASVRTVCGVAG